MDATEHKYMVMLAKEKNPKKAKNLADKLKNIRRCNDLRKCGCVVDREMVVAVSRECPIHGW